MSDLTIATEAFLRAQSLDGTPALRVMLAGDKLTSGACLHNIEGGTPSLEIQVILYRESKAVYTGKKMPIALTGTLTLGTSLAAGEYVPQVAIHQALRC